MIRYILIELCSNDTEYFNGRNGRLTLYGVIGVLSKGFRMMNSSGALFTQDYIDSTINCNHVSTVDYHSSDYISNETLDKTITKI